MPIEMKGSRRRLVMTMPAEAMIGKLSPKEQSYNKERYGTARFYVGYQTQVNNRNFFQARTKERSVPLSQSEVAVREQFRVVSQAVKLRAADTSKIPIDTAQFRAQKEYATFRGFLFDKAWVNYDPTSGTVVWPD